MTGSLNLPLAAEVDGVGQSQWTKPLTVESDAMMLWERMLGS